MRKRIVLALLWSASVIWILFIWWNSTRTGVSSGAMSAKVTSSLNSFLHIISPSLAVSHHFVRKAAHFLEFGLLSLLLCFNIYFSWGYKMKNIRSRAFLVSVSVLACALVASIDETIQVFIDGRGASPVDVMIDTSGALCFAFIFICAMLTINRIRLRKIKPVE